MPIVIIITLSSIAGGFLLGYGSRALHRHIREERELRERTQNLYNEILLVERL